MKSEENKNPDKLDYGKSKEGPYGCFGFYPQKLQCFNAVGSWDLSHYKPILCLLIKVPPQIVTFPKIVTPFWPYRKYHYFGKRRISRKNTLIFF